VAKAKQIMGGMMLVANPGFSDLDRVHVRRMTRPCGRTLKLATRVGGKSAPDGLEDRIAAHAARVAEEAAKPEPLACWGPCGRTLANGCRAETWGWKVRPVVCSGGREIEAHCPECWNKWGFIEPRKGA